MKKIFSLFLSFVFLSTSISYLCAEEVETPKAMEATSESLPDNLPEEAIKTTNPREVGKASDESLRAAKKRDWQGWLFASTSVAVAVAALLLLRDSGHAPHHNH
jgi:hypothetical protein